jgi:ubiquinone/menaquinone biosynthesis C-methylase UbiE
VTPQEQIVVNSDGSPDRDDAKQGVAGLFGRTAPLYDRVGPRFFTYFGRRLVERAQIPNGARVLDVATGKGAVLLPAVEAVGSRGHATGIDLSEAMVREAAEEISRLGLENAGVLHMDAEHLRFPDASFDCVLCGFAIFFLPRLDRALAEMRRVLTPGGRIAMSTWDSSLDERWKWFDELVEAHLPPGDDTKQAPESHPPPPVLDTPEGLEAVMTTAGFTDVEVVSETAEFVYACEDEWWSALWSHGMREALEGIEEATGPDGLARFRAAVLARMRTVRQADGIHESLPALFTLALEPRA